LDGGVAPKVAGGGIAATASVRNRDLAVKGVRDIASGLLV